MQICHLHDMGACGSVLVNVCVLVWMCFCVFCVSNRKYFVSFVYMFIDS